MLISVICISMTSFVSATDIEDLDITWSVVTLLPPADVDNGSREMEKIIGISRETIRQLIKNNINNESR